MGSIDSTRPGVVLVHGAWHRPAHFANVTSRLESEGYHWEAPQCPSSNQVAVDDVLAKDAAVIKESITKITSTGKNAVILMHSYGGVCGSEAVAEFVEESKANPKPEHGKIVHLLYICAVILPRDVSLLEDKNTAHVLHVENGLLHNLEPYNRFYNTTPIDVAYKAMQMLKAHSLESSATEPRWRGWADYDLPVTYITAKQDKALYCDPDLIKFVQRFKDAKVRDLENPILDCDHTPWLSAEPEFTAILDGVLEKSAEGSKDGLNSREANM